MKSDMGIPGAEHEVYASGVLAASKGRLAAAMDTSNNRASLRVFNVYTPSFTTSRRRPGARRPAYRREPEPDPGSRQRARSARGQRRRQDDDAAHDRRPAGPKLGPGLERRRRAERATVWRATPGLSAGTAAALCRAARRRISGFLSAPAWLARHTSDAGRHQGH